MKRIGLLVLVMSIVAGGGLAEGAAARKTRPRVVRQPYSPGPESEIRIGYEDPGISMTSLDLVAEPGEIRVMVALTDESSENVKATIQQGETFQRFCNATDEPFTIDPSRPFEVNVYAGPCGDELSTPTEGMVELTFFKR